MAKYVNETHRRRMEARRRRRRQRAGLRAIRSDAKPIEDQTVEYNTSRSSDGRATARRGPGYDYFMSTEWPELIASGQIRQTDALKMMAKVWPEHLPQPSQGNVSRWLAARAEDLSLGGARENHEPDLSHTDNLGDFTRRYFPKLLVPDFHIEWEEAIDEVVGTGGRLLLLSPQRSGKTELLIRYCLRRIAQDPNISIGWVSKTQGLAERMVGYVRQNLEHNERFVADVLGPGQTFQPPTRSGLSWTNTEFTVSTRTEIRKSPTMEAIGVGGTIVGKDFDLIILDDPQDRARCMSPSQREKDAEWLFTDFLSRKEEHTGVAFIMSRQHVDDLPGQIIRDHADDWRIMIYRSHDPACPLPEGDVEAHVNCVLWPEKRPWRWLFPQKQANPAHFQRNYQNDPRTDNTILITAEDIERCKDYDRTVGQVPRGVTRLIAGIDPADAKPVAAVLWGFEPGWGENGRRHVIDIMEAEAGIRGGRDIIKTWHQTYGCSLFVLEKNFATSWWQDSELRDYCARVGIPMPKEHYTDRYNKWNTTTGVLQMFGRMRTDPPEITIPWGDRQTQQKMERLARTFLSFDPDNAGHKHVDDDLPMAAWFPHPTMDLWVNPTAQWVQADFRQTPYVVSRTPYVRRSVSVDEIEAVPA